MGLHSSTILMSKIVRVDVYWVELFLKQVNYMSILSKPASSRVFQFVGSPILYSTAANTSLHRSSLPPDMGTPH